MQSIIGKFSKRLSRKGLYEFLGREFSSVSKGAAVLNIGAGGEIQDLVEMWSRKNGFTVLSADVDSNRNPDVVDDITQSNLSSASFDVVVVAEVLEHVSNPFRAAEEILRLLKPGGRLVLTVPFIFPLHDRPYDFFRYTKYGLALIFGEFGEVQIQERNSWFEAILVLFMRLTKERVRGRRFHSLAVFVGVILLSPFAFYASRFVSTDYLTTGYTLSGVKPLSR